MKAVILCDDVLNVYAVYKNSQLEIIRALGWNGNVIKSSTINENQALFKDTKYIFSTYGMPNMKVKDIKFYFPKLKDLFYAGGSVQEFAREFLKCGVKVYSAWAADAVAVSEFVFAQILLSNKGYFMAEKLCRSNYEAAKEYSQDFCGNYDFVVGLLGLGMASCLVAEKLRNIKCKVLAYDPFCTAARAEALGVTLMPIEKIFSSCDVISNHLSERESNNKIINYDYFSTMKEYATFINTANGITVNEQDLIKAMKEIPTRTALLDVTDPTPFNINSVLAKTPNIILTPNISGSSGSEKHRLADYIMDEYNRLNRGLPPLFSITLEMLETLA